MKKIFISSCLILIMLLFSVEIEAGIEVDMQGNTEMDFGELTPGDYRPRVEYDDGVTVRVRNNNGGPNAPPELFEVYFEEDVKLYRVDGGSDTLRIYEFITDLDGNIGETDHPFKRIQVGAVLESIPYSIRGGEYTGQATVVIELLD